MLRFIQRLMESQVLVRRAIVLLLAILGIYLMVACSPQTASPTPQLTATSTATSTITVTITSTPTPLVVGSASSARRPTRTLTPTPLRATALALTLTRKAALTLTRPIPTATQRRTTTRTPTISPTWFEKIYPSATLRKWPTYTRTPIPTRTPTRTPTFPSGKTAIFQRRQTQTSQAITQTAVAANQLILSKSNGTDPIVVLTASGEIPLLSGLNWFSDENGDGVIFAGGYGPNRQLYIIQPMDTDPYPIPEQPTSDNFQPAWSADNGGWLAFISTVDEYPTLFVMKIDGSEIYQLTDGTRFDSYPSWVPGGNKIVFVSEGTSAAMYSLDVSWLGGQPPVPLPTPVKLSNQAGITVKRSPQYSPDIQNVTWIVYCKIVSGHNRIFVMSADGKTPLADGTTSRQLGGDDVSNESDPSWSADGQSLIFISDHLGNPGDMYTLDMSWLYAGVSPGPLQVPNLVGGATTTMEYSPKFFSEDGSKIVFFRRK